MLTKKTLVAVYSYRAVVLNLFASATHLDQSADLDFRPKKEVFFEKKFSLEISLGFLDFLPLKNNAH